MLESLLTSRQTTGARETLTAAGLKACSYVEAAPRVRNP
jgi:hypothetical protein